MIPFQPLDQNVDSLRLLVLCPAKAGQICCELQNKPLSSTPAYEVLSCNCDAPEEKNQKVTIKIDGQSVDIPRTLHNAFLALRGEEPRLLWTYDLCINTDDAQERGYQVMILPYIISRAHRTLAWLGEAVEPMHGNESYWVPENVDVAVKSTYWSRRWLVQELVLAKDVSFCLGKGIMELREFRYQSLGQERSDFMDLIIFYRENRHGKYNRLEMMLNAFGDLECVDPVDNIFSLLGVADDLAQEMIEPDYTLGMHDLFAKLMAYHQASPALDNRGRVWRELAIGVTMSWQPGLHYLSDLGVDIERQATSICFGFAVQRALRGHMNAYSELESSSLNIYMIRGVFAGKVLHVGPTYTQLISSWDANKKWRAAVERIYRRQPITTYGFEFDNDNTLGRLREADDKYSQSVLDWSNGAFISQVESSSSYGYRRVELPTSSLLVRQPAETDSNGNGDEPRKFVATEGLVGFCCPGTKEGDEIYSFWECNIGVVVRKVESDKWMIVGRADLAHESLKYTAEEVWYKDAVNFNTDNTTYGRHDGDWAREREAQTLDKMMNFQMDVGTLQHLTQYPRQLTSTSISGQMLKPAPMQTIYEPLDRQTDAVRVLVLQPASADSTEVECHLTAVSLANKPAYESLSYTWGSEPPSKSILVNGQSFPVRKNLYTALVNLRDTTKPRALWIDAICINQEDVIERNWQVSLMGFIYTRAERVLVWLGVSERPVRNNYLDDSQWKAISTSPYWWRLWIVQELFLAREVRFHLGRYAFGWDRVNSSQNPSWKDFYEPREALRRLLRGRYTDKQRLEILLELFKGAKCSDERDKIYGLLGMVNDGSDDAVQVDYRSKSADLYAQVIKFHESVSAPQGSKLPDDVYRSVRSVKLSQLLQRVLTVDEEIKSGKASLPDTTVAARCTISGTVSEVGPSPSQVTASVRADKAWRQAMTRACAGEEWQRVALHRAYDKFSQTMSEQQHKVVSIESGSTGNSQNSAPSTVSLEVEPRLFVGSKGLLGVAPTNIQAGDLVCTFFGCDVALILRKGTNEAVSIIGRAQMHQNKDDSENGEAGVDELEVGIARMRVLDVEAKDGAVVGLQLSLTTLQQITS